MLAFAHLAGDGDEHALETTIPIREHIDILKRLADAARHVVLQALKRPEPQKQDESQDDRESVSHAMQEALCGFGDQMLPRGELQW